MGTSSLRMTSHTTSTFTNYSMMKTHVTRGFSNCSSNSVESLILMTKAGQNSGLYLTHILVSLKTLSRNSSSPMGVTTIVYCKTRSTIIQLTVVVVASCISSPAGT